jgi:hypothetical protein
MNWMIAGLAYLVFGLVVMTYMCPCWHPFELLIGAVIWPISIVIGIVVLVKEGGGNSDLDTDLFLLELKMIMLTSQIKIPEKNEDHRWN